MRIDVAVDGDDLARRRRSLLARREARAAVPPSSARTAASSRRLVRTSGMAEVMNRVYRRSAAARQPRRAASCRVGATRRVRRDASILRHDSRRAKRRRVGSRWARSGAGRARVRDAARIGPSTRVRRTLPTRTQKASGGSSSRRRRPCRQRRHRSHSRPGRARSPPNGPSKWSSSIALTRMK